MEAEEGGAGVKCRFRPGQIVLIKARVVRITSSRSVGYPGADSPVVECNIIDRHNEPVDPMYFHYFAEDQVLDMQDAIRRIRGDA